MIYGAYIVRMTDLRYNQFLQWLGYTATSGDQAARVVA